MRPLKKTEVCNVVSRRARYKLCKEVDGRFFSVIAGTARDFDAEMLEYENGRVTESPSFGVADEDTPASGLIYVYEDLDDAIEAASKVGGSDARAHDKRVIFKATPIGFKRPNNVIEGVTLCEAVLVGNMEWENEPALPEPVWVNVTKECTPYYQLSNSETSAYIKILHNNVVVGCFGVGAHYIPDPTPGYKVELAPYSSWSGFNDFKVFKLDC